MEKTGHRIQGNEQAAQDSEEQGTETLIYITGSKDIHVDVENRGPQIQCKEQGVQNIPVLEQIRKYKSAILCEFLLAMYPVLKIVP